MLRHKFPQIPNRYYTSPGFISAEPNTNWIMVSGRLIFIPFYCPDYWQFQSIACNCLLGEAGKVVRMAIYTSAPMAANGTSAGIPHDRIYLTAGLDIEVAEEKSEDVNLDLSPGMYWLGLGGNSNSARFRNVSNRGVFGSTGIDTNNIQYIHATSGSFPENMAGTAFTTSEDDPPGIWLKAR